MRTKKPSPNAHWMREELRALREERPDAQAVDLTVARVLAFVPDASPRPNAGPLAWRALPLAAGLAGAVALAFLSIPSANAATLQGIAKAVGERAKRHSLTYRPDAHGTLVLTNEDWIDGVRHVGTSFANGARTILGSDGKRTFRVSPESGTQIDDDVSDRVPVEDMDSYLRVPGARVVGSSHAGTRDVYTVDCRTVRFALSIDPTTRLPVRRDVLTLDGKLIERNEYEYPTRVAADLFRVPSVGTVTDYPALRAQLSERLAGPGQTQALDGVKISLKAVLVGQSRPFRLLALWTGGAKGEDQTESVAIGGRPRPFARSRPKPFDVSSSEREPMIGGQPLRGDGAWYLDPPVETPLTVRVPVWKEDRSRPIFDPQGRRLGYGNHLVGHLNFRVDDVMRVDSPDRVVWRPDGEPHTTAASEAVRSPM